LPPQERHAFNAFNGTDMIEETPPLFVAPVGDRLPAKVVQRFHEVPTSFIVDATGGAGRSTGASAGSPAVPLRASR